MLGAVEALAALSIWRGGSFGRWFGIVLGSIGVLVAMMAIPAYPPWSLTLVVLYILVVYGLVAYGGKPELTRELLRQALSGRPLRRPPAACLAPTGPGRRLPESKDAEGACVVGIPEAVHRVTPGDH